MTSKDDKKDNYSSFPKVGGLENIVDINEEEELKEVNLNRKKMIDNRRSDVGDNKKMQSTSKDPIDGFVSQKPKKVVQLRKENGNKVL